MQMSGFMHNNSQHKKKQSEKKETFFWLRVRWLLMDAALSYSQYLLPQFVLFFLFALTDGVCRFTIEPNNLQYTSTAHPHKTVHKRFHLVFSSSLSIVLFTFLCAVRIFGVIHIFFFRNFKVNAQSQRSSRAAEQQSMCKKKMRRAQFIN